MQSCFVILGSDDIALGDPNTGETITFKKFSEAEKIAKKEAEEQPGCVFYIYEMVAKTYVPSGAAKTLRKYPFEHYK
jgi:hypothetical protein